MRLEFPKRDTSKLFADYFTSWNTYVYVRTRYTYFCRARETKCDVRNESRWQTVTAAARSRFFLANGESFTEELRGDVISSSYPDSGPQGWHDRGHEQHPIKHLPHGFRTTCIAIHFDRKITRYFAQHSRVPLCHLALRHHWKKKNWRMTRVALEDNMISRRWYPRRWLHSNQHYLGTREAILDGCGSKLTH